MEEANIKLTLNVFLSLDLMNVRVLLGQGLTLLFYFNFQAGA